MIYNRSQSLIPSMENKKTKPSLKFRKSTLFILISFAVVFILSLAIIILMMIFGQKNNSTVIHPTIISIAPSISAPSDTPDNQSVSSTDNINIQYKLDYTLNPTPIEPNSLKQTSTNTGLTITYVDGNFNVITKNIASDKIVASYKISNGCTPTDWPNEGLMINEYSCADGYLYLINKDKVTLKISNNSKILDEVMLNNNNTFMAYHQLYNSQDIDQFMTVENLSNNSIKVYGLSYTTTPQINMVTTVHADCVDYGPYPMLFESNTKLLVKIECNNGSNPVFYRLDLNSGDFTQIFTNESTYPSFDSNNNAYFIYLDKIVKYSASDGYNTPLDTPLKTSITIGPAYEGTLDNKVTKDGKYLVVNSLLDNGYDTRIISTSSGKDVFKTNNALLDILNEINGNIYLYQSDSDGQTYNVKMVNPTNGSSSSMYNLPQSDILLSLD